MADSLYTVIYTERPDDPETVIAPGLPEAVQTAQEDHPGEAIHAVIWIGDVQAGVTEAER